METIKFKPSWLAKLFQQISFSYQDVTLQLTKITIHTTSALEEISFSSISRIENHERWFWTNTDMTLSSGKVIVLDGLRTKDAKKLKKLIPHYEAALTDAISLIQKTAPAVTAFHTWLIENQNGSDWLSHYDIECAKANVSGIEDVLKLPDEYLTQNPSIHKFIPEINTFVEDPGKFRISANQKFIPLELEKYKDFFDTVETHPLTLSQRQAIITHENNTRVIAGAGSGKTSVIVSKAGYLLKRRIYTEKEILLIAFNRSAADEMKERITNSINANIRTTTFHALGLSIIAAVENKKPSLSKTATNESVLKQKFLDILIELIRDTKTTTIITTYFQSFFAPYKSEFDFQNLGDYYKYVKDNGLLTLNGEYLKSYEEIEIANFLCLNGIEYQYEKQYPRKTATVDHKQYEPDFYLSDYNIYIEHFGIQRDGTTAPHINQKEYNAGIKWKRMVHQKYNTTLIETYSYEKKEGKLLENLANKLQNHGVDLEPINPDMVLEKLNATNRFDPLTNLLVTFLNHYKGGCYSIEKIREQANDRGILNARLEAFLSIFIPVLECYEKHLRDNNVIDFNDMINNAVEYVENNDFISPYKGILVDEFQDISINRARLIKALRNQEPNHRLFCVGDDWQAIYRFAGSDISIMRDFSQQFGFSETVALDRTFRFNNSLEAVATKFILENPSQIKKTILAEKQVDTPSVILHRPETKTADTFIEVLREIDKRSNSERYSVLCLGRYNYLSDGLSWSRASSEFPNLQITFKTVHSAKGLEADYVIVLGMRSGKYGFPSEITDDPILDAVLSEPEGYPHSEERRLFYVALTRARSAVHLIVDYASPSSFITEIKSYGAFVELLGAAGTNPIHCPSCQTGELVQRTGQYGTFYSCQNYPLCNYKVNACAQCGSGILVYNISQHAYICNNRNCDHTEVPCPRCGNGRLVERKGPYGSFYGCTNYHSSQCKYTEKIY